MNQRMRLGQVAQIQCVRARQPEWPKTLSASPCTKDYFSQSSPASRYGQTRLLPTACTNDRYWHEAAVSRARGLFRRRMKSSHAADIVERPPLTPEQTLGSRDDE
jgi:hypothetical protein